MTPTLFLCISLTGFVASDQFSEVRGADADLVARGLKNRNCSLLSDFEKLRQQHLDDIARAKWLYQEHIEFFERAHELTDSPELVSRCRRKAEELRERIRELEERERRLRNLETSVAPSPREVKK